MISKFGSGSRMIVREPKEAICVLQARSGLPLMTIAQEPHVAALHEDLKASVPSSSSLMRLRTVRTVRPGIARTRQEKKQAFFSGAFASYRSTLMV